MTNNERRGKHAQLMADQRAQDRDQKIDRTRMNHERIAACEFDDALWLTTYLGGVFYNPFTPDQLQAIEAAGDVLKYGIARCIAAPRGGGKSSILRYLTLKYALYRRIRFGLLICATGKKAGDSLKAIKAHLCSPVGSPLADDWPFECQMARYVSPAPVRVGGATCDDGQPVRMEWSENRIILPTLAADNVPGPIMMSLGYESDQLQGCNVLDIRPDFVLLDDLDSRQSLAAVDGTIAAKIETIIDENVAGLGGPGRGLGRFYLGTCTSRESAAYRFSDPLVKPSWSGIRIPRISKWPDRMDLWDEYITKRQVGQQTRIDPKDPASPPIDPFGREAYRFLLEHQEAMHEGLAISDPYDFDQDVLPDGSTKHVSALQKCFDYIADYGMDSFRTEHQNDPPEPDEGSEASGISIAVVTSRTNDLDQFILPDGCVFSAAIDVGMHRCHFAATAWNADAAGFVPDYFFADVRGTSSEDLDPAMAQDDPRRRMAIEQAIIATLYNMRDSLIQEPYTTVGGEIVLPTLVPVDSGSGLHTDAVYEFCKKAGPPYFPAKGFAPFYLGKPTPERIHGDHCAKVWQKSAGVWLYEFDADHWKRFVHERFLTPVLDDLGNFRRGSLSLWSPDVSTRHTKFARQIEAERWVDKFTPGKGHKAGFVKLHRDNHFLDSLAMACMAASWGGMRVVGDPQTKRTRRVVPMGDMQAAAKGMRHG